MKLLLFLTLLPVLAFGQQAPERTCRILFLNGPDSAPNKLHLFDGVASQPVQLPRLNFSPVYKLRPGNITIGLLPTPVDDPELVPAGLPSIKVPATIRDFYLLLSSDPDNKIAPVRLQLIDAGSDTLKRGQMLWFNLSKNAVFGNIGSEKLAIKPESRSIINAPTRGSEDYNVKLDFLIAGKEHRYPLCETQWRHDPRSRKVAFIIPQPGRRTPRVLVFPDYREPPAKKP